jgi:hypothetical protein
MAKPFQNRSLSEEMALVLTPLAVLIATDIAWLQSYRDFTLVLSLVGILLLSTLLGVGFRYYKAHPFVGLLTALTLFSLFPPSQGANPNDAWQFVTGFATLVGGGALTITFLVFALRVMIHGSGSEASIDTLNGPDAPDARWLGAAEGSRRSHHVKGIDG